MVRKYARICFLILFLLTLSFYSIPRILPQEKSSRFHSIAEAYNPVYSRINSIDKVISFIDSSVQARSPSTAHQSKTYVDQLDKLLRERFYHSYSHYSLADDYISFLLGKYVWDDLSAIVHPNDILKYNYAACSQQSIVFMEILRRKGYRVCKIGLQGHFCTAVFYTNSWHFYDTNKEPSFNPGQPIPSPEQLMSNKPLLYQAYANKLTAYELDTMFTDPIVEELNEVPGRNMRLFHTLTGFLSRFGWIFFGLIYLLSTPKFSFPSKINHVWHRRASVIQK